MTDRPQSRLPSEPVEVLLVEDNPADGRLVREAFAETDREPTVHTVSTGDAAVETLTQLATDESRSLPDLALVDLNLPGTDGCDLLEAIRGHSRLRRLPVLVLTSSVADEDVVRSYDAAANAYLTKPTDHGAYVSLMAAVERFWLDNAQLPPNPLS